MWAMYIPISFRLAKPSSSGYGIVIIDFAWAFHLLEAMLRCHPIQQQHQRSFSATFLWHSSLASCTGGCPALPCAPILKAVCICGHCAKMWGSYPTLIMANITELAGPFMYGMVHVIIIKKKDLHWLKQYEGENYKLT
ncbi:hypothetical protein AcV7_007042 [Taiwanofungus camphoratus]|nr:hypothetical protein AcV7_007042 [Antrodia cinnamomea]